MADLPIKEEKPSLSTEGDDKKPHDGSSKGKSTTERVIDLLNQAQLAKKDNKLHYLKQVQELIVNMEPALLDNFLDEILVFQHDQTTEVRKFVLGFIEEACKKDVEILTKVIHTIVLLLNDSNVMVVKKVMLCLTQLYRLMLQFISKMKVINDDLKATWEILCMLKNQIMGKIQSDNDGIRTHAIKFMEMVILTQSNKPTEMKDDESISLDVIPRNHPVLSMTQLREEGGTTLEALLSLVASPNISSVNLMASMGTLAAIAKQRPAFMSLVVEAFESLHANLPTALSKSQVSSVRKNLKLHLMNLLKNAGAVEYYPQITTLLTDLGASQSEMQKIWQKNLTKVNLDSIKRPRPEASAETETSVAKRQKSESGDQMTVLQAIEMTKEDLIPRLKNERVAELVIISMLGLPERMPANFQETYTPIAAAGGTAQVSHLARLISSQMTNAGIGVGAEKMEQLKKARMTEKAQQVLPMMVVPEEKMEASSVIPVIGGSNAPVVGSIKNVMDEDPSILQVKQEDIGVQESPFLRIMEHINKEKGQVKKSSKLSSSAQSRRKIKAFKLSEVKRELSEEEKDRMILSAFQRILAAEKSCIQGGKTKERLDIIVGLVTQFGGDLRVALNDFIMVDPRTRYELASVWIYQEFLAEEAYREKVEQEFLEGEDLSEEQMLVNNSYNESLLALLHGFKERLDPKDKLISRLYLEAPRLTDESKIFLKEYCEDLDRTQIGFSTLRELILQRPANQSDYLNLLLELSSHYKEQVRVQAIHAAKKLHPRENLAVEIEQYALQSLRTLLLSKPPNPGLIEWTDESIKLCLYLYLALLPLNHKLLHELASLYTEALPLVKRTILRHLEHPVRSIGMNSEELLKLVETCPSGAETLITRILHIITEKASPSPALVKHVKDLYHKRASDVRILIPVLTGLEKKEVVEVLPKLIKQSPNVVKEVFNRLLGCFHGDSTISSASPLTPSELLITLHSIEDKADMKSIIKAVSLCFGEKTIYTQEVLAVVLQQLMDKNPLPTLFMRTVIQSLSACPRLVGFAMNILSKLISKQVWKQPKVWQGFVKCCQMTKPQSYPILLQLPARQLESVFEICPELKDLLRTHVEQFTPHQRALIPRSLIQILAKDVKQDEAKPATKEKENENEEKAEEKVEEKPEVIVKKEKESPGETNEPQIKEEPQSPERAAKRQRTEDATATEETPTRTLRSQKRTRDAEAAKEEKRPREAETKDGEDDETEKRKSKRKGR
ncbi:symplekin-like [Dendronephthya gigantea]|uniref:symplekin-like n=1 Tax=Dendronephthya gigantea TaxID=151771 RepID=UPI00106AED00|nr:symplekin-like [Dendronephthya gigantea]XP_028398487.1 symplekin-like [Dendronephthya gigantea]